jgi:hypothetical protein
MNISGIAESYRNSAGLILGRIHLLNDELSTKKLSNTEKMKLRGRISTLQGMYHDTCVTARILEHYYDGSESNAVRYGV